MTGIIEMKILAEFAGVDGVLARREIFVVRRNVDQPQLNDFGLTLEEGKPSCSGCKPNIRSFRWSSAVCVTGNV